jgi:predicted transcriptional regulator YdeE
MPTSVKLSGGIVIASTQVKAEFRGIFMSAVERYEKIEGGKISKEIKDIIDKVEKTSIGEAYKRNKLTTGGIVSFKDKVGQAFNVLKKKTSSKDIDNVVDSMKNHVDNSIATPYEQIEKSIKILKKELQTVLNNNGLLKQYIVFEGMTAYNKFNSGGDAPADNKEFDGDSKPSTSAAYASYVLSPDGFEEIKSPRSKYVVAATTVSTPNIRTLPVGVPRGSAKSAVKNAAKLIAGDQTLEQAFNELNKVAVNLKYDSDTKKIHKELQNMKVQEEVLVEFKFLKTIGEKLEKIAQKFFSEVIGFFGTFFGRLKKKSAIEIIDGLDLDITGTIKLP